jgi:hypothetical protein
VTVPTRHVPTLRWHTARFDRTVEFSIRVSQDDIERARRESPVVRALTDRADRLHATESDKLRALAEVVHHMEMTP